MPVIAPVGLHLYNRRRKYSRSIDDDYSLLLSYTPPTPEELHIDKVLETATSVVSIILIVFLIICMISMGYEYNLYTPKKYVPTVLSGE